MVFECEFEDWHFVVSLETDADYRPADKQSPHSNKELVKLRKGLLVSYQMEVEARIGDENFKLYFPTVLLPPQDDPEFMDVLENDFIDYIVPHIEEYWEKATTELG